MSRHAYTCEHGYHIVVGWDPPLGTFFAQAYAWNDLDDPVFWCGYGEEEVKTVEGLNAWIQAKGYSEIPLPLKELLKKDKEAVGKTRSRPWEMLKRRMEEIKDDHKI